MNKIQVPLTRRDFVPVTDTVLCDGRVLRNHTIQLRRIVVDTSAKIVELSGPLWEERHTRTQFGYVLCSLDGSHHLPMLETVLPSPDLIERIQQAFNDATVTGLVS